LAFGISARAPKWLYHYQTLTEERTGMIRNLNIAHQAQTLSKSERKLLKVANESIFIAQA